MYNDELYHTGRKGMKWGQHIYAKDGSLNRRGRRKFNRVANSAKKSKAHTAQAKKMLKNMLDMKKKMQIITRKKQTINRKIIKVQSVKEITPNGLKKQYRNRICIKKLIKTLRMVSLKLVKIL